MNVSVGARMARQTISLEWDAIIIKNNVKIVFTVNRQLSCIIAHLKLGESSLNLYYKFWDEIEWFRSGSSVSTQLSCIIAYLKISESSSNLSKTPWVKQ